MKETAISRTKTRTKASGKSVATDNGLDSGSLVIVGSMGIVSAVIGGGALLCFVAALVNAGPLELLKGFLSAITGI